MLFFKYLISLSHPPPARQAASPSNAPDVGLGALDVEDAEGTGDYGNHSCEKEVFGEEEGKEGCRRRQEKKEVVCRVQASSLPPSFRAD